MQLGGSQNAARYLKAHPIETLKETKQIMFFSETMEGHGGGFLKREWKTPTKTSAR